MSKLSAGEVAGLLSEEPHLPVVGFYAILPLPHHTWAGTGEEVIPVISKVNSQEALPLLPGF